MNVFIYVVIAVVVVILLSAALKVVREYERGGVFRLGRFVGLRGPGLVVIIPFIENMRKIDLQSRILHTIDRGAQWRASKWRPAVFGDKQTVDLNIGLQPGEARRQAYLANQAARRRRDVPHQDITDLSQSQADGD